MLSLASTRPGYACLEGYAPANSPKWDVYVRIFLRQPSGYLGEPRSISKSTTVEETEPKPSRRERNLRPFYSALGG